jgi:hypothetical protein
MISLLDGSSGYSQIKVKRTDKYKTTFITHWGALNYECMSYGLSNAGATFKRPTQTTFDDLINKVIHIYLDDIIMYCKGISVVLKFQKLWLGSFKITFVLGTNSYILKYLQERLFSYNTNGSHLKHYVEPT